jgi:hypothetical protein
MMRKSFFYNAGWLALVCMGCATESTTPPMAHYLLAGPGAQSPEQVEVLKGTLIQLRSGDILLEAQAQLIEDAVGVQFYVINLSDHGIRLEANQFSLEDAHGVTSRLLTVKEVLNPVRVHAAQLEEKAKEKENQPKTGETLINPDSTYEGGSTNERMAKTLRGEADRLQKNAETPFVSASIPVNKRIGGMLYFEPPRTWPVQLKVHVGEQVLAASFYHATENP